jgi:hypothetical protein
MDDHEHSLRWESARRLAAADDDDMSFLLLLAAYAGHLDTPRQTLQYQAMSIVQRKRRRRAIPRPGLLHPCRSPWEQLYGCGCDQSLITFTGFDHLAFRKLHERFKPLYDQSSPYRIDEEGRLIRAKFKPGLGGRPRSLSSEACLGLTLSYFRTMSQEYLLAVYFGVTHGRYNIWGRYGRRLLSECLSSCPTAVPSFPSHAKIEVYKQAISEKYPQLVDLYCVMDGMKLNVQCPGDALLQERFYNGWKCGHFVNQLFVFAPDGTIIMAVVDAPGTKHDSEMAMLGDPSVYDQLDRCYDETGGKCSADSAFATRGRESIVKSMPKDQIPINATSTAHRDYLRQNLSLRQAAEWGMRAYQGSFPRLKMTMKWEYKGERHISLWLSVLLYNYRANNVGLNQIRTVYMPQLAVVPDLM